MTRDPGGGSDPGRGTPFRQIVENIDEVVWMTDPDKEEILYVNPAYEEVWEQPRERLYEDPRSFLDAIHPDDRERVRAALDSQSEGTYDELYRIVRPDGDIRWVRDRAVPIRNEEGTVYRVAGIAEDVTEYKKRERLLAGLHGTTQALLRTDSAEAVCDLVVRAASEALQARFVTGYLYDEAADELRPAAWTPDVQEVIGTPTASGGDGGVAWTAFVEGETRVFDDVRTADAVDDPPTPIRSELVVPIGEYGVIVACDTDGGSFDETDGEFAELLAANTEAALERIESERDLARRNERLEELSRISAIIRSINRAIVGATTRNEIEANVCQRLAGVGFYAGAWIGEYRPERTVVIRTTAGFADEHLDADTVALGDDVLIEDLVGPAHHTRTVHVTDGFDDADRLEPWHRRLLDRGCHTAAAVPLVAGEARYGVLMLYADRPGTFDEEEVAILRELGRTIGQAIRAVETRRSLISETATEFEVELADENAFFAAVSEEFGCRVTLDGVVPFEGGELLCYLTMEGADPDRFLERATDSAPVASGRCLAETDAGGRFEFRVSGSDAIPLLVDYGATVSGASAHGGLVRITAEVSLETDVRTLLSGLEEVCSGVRLVRKRTVDRPVRTVQQFRETVDDRLTDRQRDALRAAFFAGYFEWPRESTAEEVADPMDVSSSTFHFHLRHALRKMLQSFFETTPGREGGDSGQ